MEPEPGTPCFNVVRDGVQGRCGVATRRILAGSVIVSEAPLVIAPSAPSKGLYCVPILGRRFRKLLNLDEKTLKTECRLQPASFRSLMYLLTEHMPPRTHGYSFEFAVIVTLYWIAAGMSYRVFGNSFDLCRSTAFDLTAMVLDIICRVLHQVIRLPTAEELPQIGQQFANMASSPAFAQCCGAIDGCQIYFICEDADRHDEYINRKLLLHQSHRACESYREVH